MSASLRMAVPPVLRVGIEEARGLLAEDLNGFSDPFVQLQLLDQAGRALAGVPTFKTPVKRKTLAPVWGSSFTYGEAPSAPASGKSKSSPPTSADVDVRVATTLRFFVYDFDGFKRDDSLGVVDIPVDVALDLAAQGSDAWYQLVKDSDSMIKDATGELRITFARGAPAAKPIAGSGTALGEAVDTDSDPNLLYVTIDSGKDLVAMDGANHSDPFVKLSLSGGQKFQTAAVEKTLKPHWDERFAFLLRDPHVTLELQVEDEDHTVNDFLGRAQLVLADVLVPNKETRADVKLLDKKLNEDKDRGTLHLRLRWVHDDNAESITTSMKSKKKRQQRSLLHQLTSTFHLAVPDVQIEEDDDAARFADEDELLEDESDEEADAGVTPPLPPGESMLRFLTVVIHRAEELPPLDALTFEKEKHKPIAPGGGIDAYVAAWISEQPEDFIRTRIHTRKGRRDELSTSFHESLMLALPPAPSATAPTNVTLAIMDWDEIGGDEVVSHLDLRDVDALAKEKEGKPFWWNLYGAPLVGLKDKAAVTRVNEDTTDGSTYRGRLLLSLKIQEKPSTTYENKHQKRSAKKLPRELYPSSQVYRLRAHFLTAIGIPDTSGKYYISLSCGMNEITSSQKGANNRAVEWNETEESDRLLLPADASQIPDIVLSLCTGEWEKRVVVSYARFNAAELLKNEFKDTGADWISLRADPTTGAVTGNEFPGKVLVRLGFGTLSMASAQVWDQKALINQITRRVPYQVRVRVHDMKDSSPDADAKKALELNVQCWDQEQHLRDVEFNSDSVPTVISLDPNLPQLKFASQVLIHVHDPSNKDSTLHGTLAISLDGAAGNTSTPSKTTAVTVCTAQQLKSDTRPFLPQPQWLPLVSADGQVLSTELLTSVELIRRTFPDERLPPPEPVAVAVPC